MARKFDILALIRKGAREGGRYRRFVGKGVCLTVQGNSAIWERQWRDPVTKKIRTASLGPAKGPDGLNLTEARNKGEEHAVTTRNGTAHGTRRIGAGKTFGDAVEEFILYKSGLSNGAWRGGARGEEASAYRRTLKGLWTAPITTLDTPAIGDVLEKMRARTAEKTRVRIKAVLDWAKAKGYRSGDNPAAKELLRPRMASPPEAKHFPALPASDLPALMTKLAAIDTPASHALRFTILTAGRTGDTRGAMWSEIFPKGSVVPTADGSTTEALAGDTWIIPASRMKEEDNKEHRIPLLSEMSALLGERSNGLIFAMGERAMLHLLHRLRPGFAVHGLRSSFTDWAARQGYSSDLRDTALHHALGNTTNRAYQRDELCEERRPMMQAWADYCCGETGADALAA